jgi:hypothetical protein
MAQELKKEEVEVALDKEFEEFLVKSSHLIPTSTNVELLKLFYNQGYLDCIKYIKRLWPDQQN